MDTLFPVLGASSFVFIVGWVLHAMVQAARQRHTERMKIDLQEKLLARFASPDDLIRFLDSGAGRRLLGSLTAHEAGLRRQIVGHLQTGLILLFLAAAFFVLRTQPELADDGGAMLLVAGVAAAVGLGFLSSAALAHWLRPKGNADARDD